jgi:HK97 family phage major capsid protein/HK97 family phage prohead protease
MSTTTNRPVAPEQRTITAPVSDVRAEGRTLRGFAALYDQESRDLGGYRETIAPGAFSGVLAGDPDVVLTFNHDPSRILARTTSGTLRLRDDEARGLAFEADLGDGPTAQDVRDMVRRGDVSGASFRFTVAPDGERWEGEKRTLTRIGELIDLSLATTPAYDGPRVELRSASQPDTTPEAQEAPMPLTTEERTEAPEIREERRDGGLRAEDRTADAPTVEHRVLEAMRATPRGESRSLTHATTDAVQPDDQGQFLIDLLREPTVLIRSGVTVIPTARRKVVLPVLTADTTADFFNELEEITPSDPTLAEFEVEPKAIKALVRGSTEAFEDSQPDLLGIVNANLAQVLAAKLDREGLVGNAAKGFLGLTNIAGTQTLSVAGALTSYDPILKAVGMLAEAQVPGPYAVLAHPRVVTSLGLLKTATDSNESLPAPAGAPPIFSTGRMGVTTGTTPTTTVVVFAPRQVYLAMRRDATIEVDRSQEFSADTILVRGTMRAAVGIPHPEAVVKLTGVSAPAIA